MEAGYNITKTGQKENLSVRIAPGDKQWLMDRALDLGQKLSDVVNTILANHIHTKKQDNIEIRRLEEKLHQSELREIEFRWRLQQLEVLQRLLADPRFRLLYNQLKGRKDMVVTPDGHQYQIRYNKPTDLMQAMIHSFKLKP